MRKQYSDINPSIQCSVCGHWKRLEGKSLSGHSYYRFFNCCEVDGKQIEHDPPVCDDCCQKNCPNKNKK